jgi:hypothetical protein
MSGEARDTAKALLKRLIFSSFTKGRFVKVVSKVDNRSRWSGEDRLRDSEVVPHFQDSMAEFVMKGSPLSP